VQSAMEMKSFMGVASFWLPVASERQLLAFH
jgi:hypothetical protein